MSFYFHLNSKYSRDVKKKLYLKLKMLLKSLKKKSNMISTNHSMISLQVLMPLITLTEPSNTL